MGLPPLSTAINELEYILSYFFFSCVNYKHTLWFPNMRSCYTYHLAVCFLQLTKSLCMAMHLGPLYPPFLVYRHFEECRCEARYKHAAGRFVIIVIVTIFDQVT